MKNMRYLVTAPLFAIGLLLIVYGLFALTFREGGGHTYVKLIGHEIDAHWAAAVSLLLAVIAIGSGVLLVRGRHSHE